MRFSFIDSTRCLFNKPFAIHPIHIKSLPFLSSLIQQCLVQIPHIILLSIVHRIRHLPHLQDIIVRHRRQRPVPLLLTLLLLSHVRIPRQIVHLRRVSSSSPTRSRSHTITRRSSPAVASTFPRIGDHSPANTAPVCPSSTWYGNLKFRSSHSFTDVSELAVTNNRGKCGLNRTTLQSFAWTGVLPINRGNRGNREAGSACLRS